MKKRFIIIVGLLLLGCFHISAQSGSWEVLLKEADREASHLMKQGDIPGLAMVIVKGDTQEIRYYGYANAAKKIPVTANTLFEIGSCTKAFTALAVTKLVQEGKIDLAAPVTNYLPWLRVTYKDKSATITIAQLLHHTSGIPWRTISGITPMEGPGALEKTVRTLQGQELENRPGKEFEYATINYDVLALVVQQVAGVPFEEYLQYHIIDALQLANTAIGRAVDPGSKAMGYKPGFFKAREFNTPVFAGNNAAGYIISNATDMAKWLKFQMGMNPSDLYDVARITQQRDETVPPHGMLSYASGWDVSISGNGEINHSGFNPNFTAYVAFRPQLRTGIVILANAASNHTSYLGERMMKLAAGDEMEKPYEPGDGGDGAYSLLSVMISLFILAVLAYLLLLLRDTRRGNRVYTGIRLPTIRKIVGCLLLLMPFAVAFYVIPQAMAGFTWDSIFLWAPLSLQLCLSLLGSALFLGWLAYSVSLVFPEKNKFRGKVPILLLLGIMAGLANMIIIVIITSSLDTNVELKYLIFFYVIVSLLYLLGRRYVQVGLLRFSLGITYGLRKKLTAKIFSTSYQHFEKINKGRVYTALNDDVGVVGESSNLIITLITSLITAIGAFIYLASIAFWATCVTVLLVGIVAVVYYITGKRTSIYFEQARDKQNRFMTMVNGMVEGFKELNLQRGKKLEYKKEMDDTAGVYRDKIATAGIRFVNVFMIGELLLIIVLGVVTFAFPKLFPSIETHTVRSFVVILLYLIGPINSILGSMPAVLQVRVAWKRINQFLLDIPANFTLLQELQPAESCIKSIRANNLRFEYKNDQGAFSIGPVSLHAYQGEIVFIIGGNGSGKTTFAKLLTGLYEPDAGEVMINDKVVPAARLGEYFSAVFSPAFLFERIYNVDLAGKQEEVQQYLRVLGLEDKVTITDNRFSTLNLSGGQRKRLALLLCYLEDSPIYLFDEWAADQDPDYRKFFYRTLLPEMRAKGKIVIAITHDDHYFDVADKVWKMDQGKMKLYSEGDLYHADYTNR